MWLAECHPRAYKETCPQRETPGNKTPVKQKQTNAVSNDSRKLLQDHSTAAILQWRKLCKR